MQAEEMCRARNARVVVAHRLFTLPRDLFGRPGRNLADKVPEILLYPFLVLRSWRNKHCRSDEPALIEIVAMIEEAPGCFRGGLPSRCPRGCLYARYERWLVFADHAQRLMAGKNQLDRPHHDAAERIAAGHLKSTIAT